MHEAVRPIHLAERAHAAQHGPRSFQEDVQLHLSRGVVVATCRVFVLARPVFTAWPSKFLVDPTRTADEGDGRAWWLYLLGGDWAQAALHMPYYLPIIGWERHGRVHWLRTSTIVRHALRDAYEGGCTESAFTSSDAGQRGEERGAKFAYGTSAADGIPINHSRRLWV